MKRKEILRACQEAFEDESSGGDFLKFLEDYIDDVESQVNGAIETLEAIRGYEDLHMVEDCYKRLERLSGELY